MKEIPIHLNFSTDFHSNPFSGFYPPRLKSVESAEFSLVTPRDVTKKIFHRIQSSRLDSIELKQSQHWIEERGETDHLFFRFGQRRASLFRTSSPLHTKIFLVMPARKKQLGKDAIVSILTIYLHPSQHIRRVFPNPAKGHRLNNLTVLRQEHQRISRREQLAVVVTHPDFVNEDGTFFII